VVVLQSIMTGEAVVWWGYLSRLPDYLFPTKPSSGPTCLTSLNIVRSSELVHVCHSTRKSGMVYLGAYHQSVCQLSLVYPTKYIWPRAGIMVVLIKKLSLKNIKRSKAKLKNGVFWDVTPCGSCNNRRFRGT
jgi:hypothetical protein